MADYFTHFSCVFDVGSAANAERAVTIFEAFAAELDDQEGFEPGFDLELDPDHGPGALWISSDGYGEPEHVIAFVLRCADAFDLSGVGDSCGRSPAPSPASTGSAAARSLSTSAGGEASPGSTASIG